MLWKAILEAYFIYFDVNVLISIEYSTQDEFNEEAKNITLKGLLEIMDKLHRMYGREWFQVSDIFEGPHYILKEKENIIE